MRQAVAEARRGMGKNHGGPFGAVLVLRGRVIARAHNEVLARRDPTAHAEMLAIRRGARALGRFDLSDCILYSTCEPCPMCLGAILWARIPTLYFGCLRRDAAAAGFDDAAFYEFLAEAGQAGPLRRHGLDRDACLELLREWTLKHDRTPY